VVQSGVLRGADSASEDALELAAGECDWLFLHGKTRAETLAIRDDVLRRAEHGREVRFALNGMLIIRESMERAEAEIAVLRERADADRTARAHVLGLQSGWWGTAERMPVQSDLTTQMQLDGSDHV